MQKRVIINLLTDIHVDQYNSPGISALLVFKCGAAKILYLMPDDTADMCGMIEKISGKIKAATLKLKEVHTLVTLTGMFI